MTLTLLTEAEAAAAVRLCPRTLRKERQAGRLTYVRIGRTVRYTTADLESFIEGARECHSTAAPTPRIGTMTSRSTASAFEEALARKESAMRQRSRPTIGKLRVVSESSAANGQ